MSITRLGDWTLENACEDLNVLWQLANVAEVQFGVKPRDAAEAAAAATVQSLAHLGLIEVGRLSGNAINALDSGVLEATLHHRSTWEQPAEHISEAIWYCATDYGQEVNEKIESLGMKRASSSLN